MAYQSELLVQIDRGMAKVEKGLNEAGYTPMVSFLTGVLRIVLGKIEILASLYIGAIVLAETKDMDRAVEVILHYSSHGLAKILRGAVEIFPIIGNLTCYGYDKIYRYAYQFEKIHLPGAV